MKHKTGFVSIIGNPNAGKSTLLNYLIGKKISIVSHKIHTTRKRIFGIYNEKKIQIIFSDTPGFLKPNYELQKKMNNVINQSFYDADVILFLTQINDFHKNNEEILNKLLLLKIPIIILINKIDLSYPIELEKNVEYWHQKFPKSLILPISVLKIININFIILKLKELIPESDPYFEKNKITDKNNFFLINEIIREKILLNFNQEIPYASEVSTTELNENVNNISISSVIYVERESQKGIIIGHQGHSIKRVIKKSVLDMKEKFKKDIILNLYVKVKKNWRKNKIDLKNFGYSF